MPLTWKTQLELLASAWPRISWAASTQLDPLSLPVSLPFRKKKKWGINGQINKLLLKFSAVQREQTHGVRPARGSRWLPRDNDWRETGCQGGVAPGLGNGWEVVSQMWWLRSEGCEEVKDIEPLVQCMDVRRSHLGGDKAR